MNPVDTSASGGCLCGAVAYRVSGPLRPVIACHCRQCRRTSGHYAAATGARRDAVKIADDQGVLRWFRSSESAERGFCARCGSSLFWRSLHSDFLGIWAGSLDEPTGLQVVVHIGTADAGDYYELGDDVPRIEGYDHGIDVP